MTTEQAPGPGRVYRGMTSEQRHDDRRRRLLEAGLELFGTAGYAATTIEQVCQSAGVTARNFYDHFEGREDLLVQVYEGIVRSHAERVVAALAETAENDLGARISAGVGTAIRLWLADDRCARVAFLEVVGVSPVLEERRLDVIDSYAALLLEQLAALGAAEGAEARTRIEIVANALVGGVVHVLTERLTRPERAPVDRLVDELTQLFVTGIGSAVRT